MKRYKFFYDQLCSEAHSCGMEKNKDGEWLKYEDVKKAKETLKKIICNREVCILEGHGPVPNMCGMCPIGEFFKEIEGRE